MLILQGLITTYDVLKYEYHAYENYDNMFNNNI